MMNSLHDGLIAWGVPPEHLHFEAFGPATVGKTAKTPDAANNSDSFQIRFLRSNKTLDWNAAGGVAFSS